MKQPLKSALKLVTAACLAGLIAGANPPLSLEKLTRKAERIVLGKVRSVRGYQAEWPRVGQVIFSDVTLKVEETWKGVRPREDLVLQVPGGTTSDGVRMVVSGAPTFQVGEKVLVFTTRMSVTHHNNRDWVVGWELGKYTVKIQRVLGKPGHPISEDILCFPLKRKVDEILRKLGH